jgi:hemerythrin-like domain-containing protein
MSHDDFEGERYRVERIMEILEHGARRLEDRAHVPLALLKDAVTFLRASEESAYETALEDDSEPALTGCLDQHIAARRPLQAMEAALQALECADAQAVAQFVAAARAYVTLRRDHLRVDDRLFAHGRQRRIRDEQTTPATVVESPQMRLLYDRLIESAAMLDIGAPTAFPSIRRRLDA